MAERFLPMRQPLRKNNSNIQGIISKHEAFLSKNKAPTTTTTTTTTNTQPLQNHGQARRGEAMQHRIHQQQVPQDQHQHQAHQRRQDYGAEQRNYIPPSAIPVQRNDEVFAAERALINRFDPITSTWKEGELMIQINRKPFADGSMRAAYKMKVLSGMDLRGSERQWVAKLSKDPREDPRQYAKDVEMQMEARIWADQYNKLGVPKKVEFLEAYLAVLPDRGGSPTCLIERFVDGQYQKYNDNWDWSDDRRNTPQAFSHWSWEASGHRQLICDLQGVGDVWTDPQIHTIDGRGFGRGNAGLTGVRKFFLKHTCNGICTALGLKSMTGRVKGDRDQGTQWSGLKARERKRTMQLHNASVGMTVDGGAAGGITLPLLVVSVHSEGPAWHAGVQRGDTIISIDGQNVHGYSADEVKKLLSGEQGTLVKILLKSGNKNVEVSLTRRPLQNNNNNNNFSAPRVAPRVVAAPPRAPPPPAEAAHECDAAAGEKERHLALPEEDEPSSGHSTGAAQEWVVEKKFVAPKYRVPGAGGAYYTSVPGDGVAEVKEVRRVALDGPVLDDDAVQMQGEAPVPPPRRRKIVC